MATNLNQLIAMLFVLFATLAAVMALIDGIGKKPNPDASRRDKFSHPEPPKDLLCRKDTDAQGFILGRKVMRPGRYPKTYGAIVCSPFKDADGQRLMIVGGSGSNKTTVFANTLFANPDVPKFIADIKDGELTYLTRRDDDDSVMRVNIDRRTCGWNTFYKLTPDSSNSEIYEEISLIVNSILPMPSNTSGNEAFFVGAARDAVTGIFIHRYKEGDDNLPDMCRYALSKPLQEIIDEVISESSPEDDEHTILNRFVNGASDTISGISMNMAAALKIYAIDDNIIYALRDCPVKADPTMLDKGRSISLISTERELTNRTGLIAMISRQVLDYCGVREQTSPLLVVLEEFNELVSRCPELAEDVVAASRRLRYKGVNMVLLLQSMEGLSIALKGGNKAVQELVANMNFMQVLSVGASSIETQEIIIRAAGTFREIHRSYSPGKAGMATSTLSYSDENILTAADFMSLPTTGECVVISTKHGYMRLAKSPYYEDPVFKKIEEDLRDDKE